MSTETQEPAALYTVGERLGLGRTGAKLRDGQAMTIAYLGGSITQAGARDGDGQPSTSYRNHTTNWFRQQFPDTRIVEVMAGIGGTASDLGAYRLEEDVLGHAPDLVFVEFAVNDGGMDDEAILAAMEGIVRHTLLEPDPPELCFVYTLAQGHLPDYAQGLLPRTARIHERLADHYGIPTVNMALPVAVDLNAGALAWETFSSDSCHPTPAGHERFASTLTAALSKMLSMPIVSQSLPAPLGERPMEHAHMVSVTAAQATAGWKYEPLQNNGGWECFDGVLVCDEPDTTLSLPFEGSSVGLYYSLGPSTGDLLWAVDEDEPQPVRVFDDYAPKFWRPHYRILTDSLTPGKHVLHLQVGPEADPRAEGQWTKLAHLLVN